MRIVVLVDLLSEDSSNHDPVAEQVAAALEEGEHEGTIIGVWRDLKKLIDDVEAAKPQLVFNLCESFGDVLFGAVGIVALLDLLGVRYTGGGPGEFFMQQDKALAKKLLAFDSIKYPDFAVFSQESD